MPLEVIVVKGTPQAIGHEHARACAEVGRAMIQARLQLALQAMAEAGMTPDRDRCLRVAEAHLAVQGQWAPRVQAEFMALAEGLQVSPAELLIGNGYTDYIDVLRADLRGGVGCTSFIATGQATADGFTYVGQTWDMHAFAEQYLRVFRLRPERGPGWVTLTTAGCLSLIGLNEAGIAVGNTNLVPNDARPGAIYLALIHRALQSETSAAACAAITEAPRASGHYYYLADAAGRAWGIETTATRHAAVELAEGLLVHANHYRDPELIALVGERAGENTRAREELLDGFLRPRAGRLTLEDMMAGLRLTEGPHPVCRPRPADPKAVSTCAAAIMCPQRRTIWIAAGHPAEAEFEALEV